MAQLVRKTRTGRKTKVIQYEQHYETMYARSSNNNCQDIDIITEQKEEPRPSTAYQPQESLVASPPY